MAVNPGPWKCLGRLGQGGFGAVEHWQNETTKENIAIKRCHFKHEIPDKMWERWKMEVFIMSRLNHPNVIRAVDLPEQLTPEPDQPPLLAMEFCEGGDLRKVLNRPENCCGLKESEIRQLVAGVGSAIEYLHGNRIIHRDLKPENIVLMKDEHQILYKIIDLGYAKELNMTSNCDSFVGTVQYLAPELYNVPKPYSKTVDYWSFGSLVFECITGFRPFLPTSQPVEWHAEVCKKSPEDICAQVVNENDKRIIKFYKTLPTPNRLCRPLQGYFEQWLRLMLRWDSKARGGGVIDIDGVERPKCFYILEQMLALKIIHIFYVEENRVLSYPVKDTYTILDVQGAIEKETGVPKENQDLKLANGIRLMPTDMAVQGCFDATREDLIVFLFRHGQISIEPYKKKKKTLPPNVQQIVKEVHTLLPFKEQRRAWAEAVSWCCEQNRDYRRLVSSHRAALLNLLRSNSVISTQKSYLVSSIEKMMAMKEQFNASLEFDLQQYKVTFDENVENNGQYLDVFQKWTRLAEMTNSFNSLHEKVKRTDVKVTALSSEITELQKSSVSKTKQANQLEGYEEKAKSLYDQLRRATTGDQNGMMSHERMRDIVGNCFVKGEEVTKELFEHLGKVLKTQSDLDEMAPEVELYCREVEAAQQQLILGQRERQADMWALLRHMVSSIPRSESGALPPAHTNFVVQPSKTLMVDMTSMSTNNMESLRLMDDCRTSSTRLQEMVQSMLKDQEESSQFLSVESIR